ncbi:ATP-binding protein [Yoonia sp. BS5-3]|uniref:histidine kinase n=1 Tax=Yoonia phaeophyticola TaxID=3137369 RepID=A0ABZ2V019_9RHOB
MAAPRAKQWLSIGYVALAGIPLLGIVFFLAFSVAQDLENLGSAHSDNVQWTLSQTEVEFLEFSKQLSLSADGDATDLQRLRRRFDVFYSRINILESATVYRPLMENEIYAEALTALRAFLDETVPLIDAGDDVLRAGLPALEASAASNRSAARTVANAALEFFAREADQRRRDFAQTLIKLASFVAVLIAALAITVFYLRRLNLQRAAQQREAEEAAARMDTVIQTSLDGVIVANAKGQVLAFNTAAETIFGHKSDDVLGQKLGPLIVPGHLLDAHEAGMARMRAGGEKRVVGKGRVQLEAKHKAGTTFPVELAIQTAETTEGTIFIAFLRDISVAVAAEKDLTAARDQALAADRLKTEFLATMSHEIRTPLNGLLGNLSLLLDTRLNPNQLRYTRNMETSGDLLLQHISDVLDLSRYDVGHTELRSEPLNIASIVQSIVDSQAGLAANNNTTIEWGWVGPPSHWVRSDRDALQHILLNLVGNAVKFTRDGKVVITVEVEKTSDDLANFVFRVQDTGQGMDADLQGRIFDDFVTGTVAYNRDVGGTGLGLGIVRRSVAALNGQIDVDSAPDMGSTFEVRLPLAITDAEPEQPQTEHSAKPLFGLHILIVEDNKINRMVAHEMLVADGHSVEEAHDGMAAVEMAGETPFDLILMDISMPVMDGRAATRAIRQGGGICADTPIIALTANAMASEQAAFLEDGMNSVLIKPLSQNALRQAIDDIAVNTIKADVIEPEAAHRNEMREILGEETYQIMVARFVAEVDELHTWLLSDPPPEPNEIAARCHKVAGSAGTFSVDAYRKALLAIEDAAKAVDLATMHDGIAAIEQVWQEVGVAP